MEKYTQLFPVKDIIKELKEIKMNLPVGLALPIDIYTEYISELYGISDITIFKEDRYLIFTVKIPLIFKENYQVYYLIPLSIQLNDNCLALIETETEYLALSNDNEKFLALTQNQWKLCHSLRIFKLCKDNQPIHHRDTSRMCEVLLLKKQQNLPESYNIKYITINRPIWNRLSQTHSYFVQNQKVVQSFAQIKHLILRSLVWVG